MIAEQVAAANADLSIADELSHVTSRVAHTFASGGAMGLSSAWTAAVVEFVAPSLAQMAEWMVDAIAYASDLDASTLEAEQIGEVVDQHITFLAAYGDLIESAATGATVAEGSDPKLAVAGLLGDDRMATLNDRTVRHLRNQLISLVLKVAGPGTIQAVAAEVAERTKLWVTMDDDRVRDAHADMFHGPIGVDEQFDCDGVLCDGPGDPVLPPELLFGCRCITVPGDTESTEDWLNVIFEIERKLAAGEMPPVQRNGPNGVARQVVDAIRPTQSLPVPVLEDAVIAPYPTAPPSTVKKGRPLWPWLLPLLLAGEDEDEVTVEGEFAMRTETHPVGTLTDAIRTLTTAGMVIDGGVTHLHTTWAPQWDAGPGIMVALRPTPEQAEALAIDGGDASGELHVTLAYLGKTDEWPEDMRDRVAEAVALVAQTGSVIEAKVAAVACFEDNDDRPLVWFIDGDGINELRAALVVLLDEVHPSLVRRDHGFLPHTTAQYDPTPEQEAAAAERVAYPLTFGAVELCWGSESTLFPFPGDDMPEPQEMATTFSTDPGTVAVGSRVEVDGTGMQGTVDLVIVDGRLAGIEGDIEATTDDPVYVVRVWEPDDEGVYAPTEQMLNAHAGGLTPVAEFGDPVDNPEPPEIGDVETDEPSEEMTVGIGEPVAQTWTVCPPRPSGAFRPAEFAMSAYRAELDARADAGDWDWEAVMCVEGQPSGDYRLLAPGSLKWRSAPSFNPAAPEVTGNRLPRPLSLMLMLQNPETGGHALAYIAGSIWEIERDGANIVGRGFYSRLPWGEMARELVDEGALSSTSIDLQPDFTYEILVGADGEEVMVVTEGTVMGFTICAHGAIGEAEIWNLGGEDVVAVDDDEAEMLVASGFAVWTLDDGCYAQAEALELAAAPPDASDGDDPDDDEEDEEVPEAEMAHV